MTKKRLSTLLALAFACAIALVSSIILLASVKSASAYDGLPGEFGNIVGNTVTVSDGANAGIYVNYERGYVKYAVGAQNTSDPSQAVAHVGGKNVNSDGEAELISAQTMTSVKNWDTLVDANSSGNRIAYGAGWSAQSAVKVGNAFKDKWTSLIEDENYNLGIPCSNINLYTGSGDGDAVVFGMEFRYGDSIYDNDDGNGGRKNLSYLMYNVLNDEVYLVSDGFTRLTGEVRRIGAPVSNQLTGIKITGTDGENNAVNENSATVQVFETGILIADETSGGKVTHAVKHEGLIEKISDTEYKIYPLIQDQDVRAKINGNYSFIGDIDGTWHALRTARTSRIDGRLAVEYNFRAGCIEVVYNSDDTLYSRMAYAGQNFAYATDGTHEGRVNIPVENFTTDEHLWENNEDGVDSSALAMYRSLSGNENATKDDVKNAFRAGYMELLESGIIPGYRCSWIKVWDILCVDYKYSPDSMYGFDGVGSAGRERMFTLVYSGAQNKVYGVGDAFWQAWKEDSTRRALGAPISNVLENVTISGMTFSRIQIFEQGYIYANQKGSLNIEYGATADSEYENFLYVAAPPEKPDKYGSETQRFTATENNRKVEYINYQKGAVKATETYAKIGYVYDYYPGRNFVAQNGGYTAQLLTFDELYSDGDFTCETYYNDLFNGGIDETTGKINYGVKSQIKEKIKSLLDEGFFIGFLEDKFKAWNGTSCQQFIYGDSTALPWGGDSRTNVSALIYNADKGEVFLLKDAFMEIWGGSDGAYTALGAPAGDEFTLAGNPNVRFQYFYGTSTQNNQAFAVSVGYNEATYYTPNNSMAYTVNPEQYLKDIVELSTPLSGIEIEEPETTTVNVNGYIEIEYVITGAAADATVTVTSSDESIAEVMADGSVEFKKAGSVTITVTVTDGVNTFSDSVTFTVTGGRSAAVAGTLGFGGDWILPAGLIALLAVGSMAVVANKKRKAL